MAWHNNPRIVTDGLVLHLDAADRNSYPGSGTTWYDLNRNRNMGLKNSPTYISDFGGGFLLDGVNDYMNSTRPTGYAGNGTFTYEVWIKFNSGDSIGNGAHIIGNNARADALLRGANGNNSHLTIDGSGNLRVFTFSGGGGFTDFDTGFDISIGEICQVGMIHSASTNKAGIKNGQISSFQTRWSTQNFNYLLIGGEHNEANYFTRMSYPNITIFSVKVYNKVLTDKEILQNYNATKSRFGLP